MITKLADLYEPSIWIKGIAEQSTRNLRLLSAGILVKNTQLDQFASGAGNSVTIPFFGPQSTSDEIQVEDTAPTINGVSNKEQVAVILNRVLSLGATALAQAISAMDPVGFIASQLGYLRNLNRENTVLAIVRGIAKSADFAGVLLDLTAVDGTGASLSADDVVTATGFTGTLRGKFQNGGVIFMHSAVETSLLKADLIDTRLDSEGKFVMNTFMGLQVITNDVLRTAVAGQAGKYVYETYIFAPGAIAYGEKAQTSGVDVASVNYIEDTLKNNTQVIDRTRFLMTVQGASWKSTNGAPAGQSYTNAELQAGTWELVVAQEQLPFVSIKTNG